MNYIKQNFSDGQVLKASHLNHIEEGLEQMGASLVEIKQSDWSQADENKIDYIKNKPFETINLNLEYDGVVGDKFNINNMFIKLTDKAFPLDYFKEGSLIATYNNGEVKTINAGQEMVNISSPGLLWTFCDAVWVFLENTTLSGYAFEKGTYVVVADNFYISKANLTFVKPIEEVYIPSTIPVIQSSQKGASPNSQRSRR